MVQVFGTTWCGDCHRAKGVLERLQVPYRWIDIDQDPLGRDLVVRVAGKVKVPVLVFPDGSTLVEPMNDVLEQKLVESGLKA